MTVSNPAMTRVPQRGAPSTRPRLQFVALLIVGSACGDDTASGGGAGSETTGSGGSTGSETTGGESTGESTTETSTSESSAGTGGEPQVCGNGVLEPGEACDDGNTVAGDGCSADCEMTTQTAWRVNAGPGCTCAQLSEGRLRCWGAAKLAGGHCHPYDHDGHLGDDELPVEVGDVPLPYGVMDVELRGLHSCVVSDLGEVYCWGRSDYGQAGPLVRVGDLPYYAWTLENREPMDLGEPVQALALGALHTCVLLSGGRVQCWGFNGDPDWGYGQLGYGHTQHIGDDEPPGAGGDVNVGGPVVELHGGEFTCARLEGGGVRCWGPSGALEPGVQPICGGAGGWLGYGHTEHVGDDETPADAGDVPLGGPAIDLDVADRHACAVLEGGDVVCWGCGTGGVLGYGIDEPGLVIGDDETPADMGPVPLGEPAMAVEVGGSNTCALLAGGRVKCWGSNLRGRLGLGHDDPVPRDTKPVDLPEIDIGGSVQRLSVTAGHMCALLPDAAIRCWGSNGSGQLGYGHTNPIGDDETPSAAGDVPYE